MPGKSRSRKCPITFSSGSSRPPSPTGKNRGRPSGTLTRAKRSSPDSGSRASTPRLKERPEMYGKGWPGPTPSGVRTGKISRWKRASSSASSSGSRASTCATTIPSSASAGRSAFFHSFAWRAVRSSTRSRTSDSAARGVSPSAERTASPAAAWPIRPATRTMKNSSRLDETKRHIRTRSRIGRESSPARSSSLALYSNVDSSRFNSRHRTSCEHAVAVIGQVCRYLGYQWVTEW